MQADGKQKYNLRPSEFLAPKDERFSAVRTFPWGVAFALITATASYFMLERPILRLKNRFYQPVRSSSSDLDAEAQYSSKKITPRKT